MGLLPVLSTIGRENKNGLVYICVKEMKQKHLEVEFLFLLFFGIFFKFMVFYTVHLNEGISNGLFS